MLNVEGPVYGITNGTKWFFYCYPTRETAEQVLERAEGFATPQSEAANIIYERPFKLTLSNF